MAEEEDLTQGDQAGVPAAGRTDRPGLVRPVGTHAPNGGRARSQAEDAHAYLRSQILSLEMAPGSTFTEGQIASELNTSKTPVREALVRLEHDGLVKSMPRAGYQVTPITLLETRRLSELRSILLVEIAGRVAESTGLSGEEQAEMERLIAEAEAVRDAGTPEVAAKTAEVHREIDMLIVRALGNPRLNATVEEIFDGLDRARVLSGRLSPRAATQSHAPVVLEAIRRRDPNAARDAMRARVEQGQQILLTVLIENSSLMSAGITEAGPV